MPGMHLFVGALLACREREHPEDHFTCQVHPSIHTHNPTSTFIYPSIHPRHTDTRTRTQAVALLLSLALAPFRFLGDKLVWSKVRQGLGGRVSE